MLRSSSRGDLHLLEKKTTVEAALLLVVSVGAGMRNVDALAGHWCCTWPRYTFRSPPLQLAQRQANLQKTRALPMAVLEEIPRQVVADGCLPGPVKEGRPQSPPP